MEKRDKGLLCVFADAFWQDYLAGADTQERLLSSAVSNQEKMTLLANASQIALHLKGDLPLDNPTIEALIWAVSQYCHGTLNVEPRVDIQSHLLRCARTEPELHALKEYYRDHFCHCLEVCFLGHFLLDLTIGVQPLWRKVGAVLGLSKRTEVLRLWYVASLLHDIGYLMDAMKATNEALDFFKTSSQINEFARDVQQAMDSLSKKIDDDDFCGYVARDKPSEDHGVIAALHLQALLKSISQDDKGVQVDHYAPAIRAIATHNSRKHTVSFAEEPISFLLILCDTVQEWIRPRLLYSTAPTQMLTWLMGQNSEIAGLLGPFRSLTLHNIQRATGVYTLLPESENLRLCLTLEYDEIINSNSGVFNLWLDATCNLQRLDMTGLECDIDVEYVTPYFQLRPGADFEQQFHRLQTAATDTHMGFLQKWFPQKKGTYTRGDGSAHECVTNDAISYFTSEMGRRRNEHLVLRLKDLCGKKLISRDIDDFRKDLRHWKHYNDDRIFAGDYAPSPPH